MTDFDFGVGAIAGNLRITEIMYHPLDVADPNEEFIELKNVGAETIVSNDPGCIMHIRGKGEGTRVAHTVELLWESIFGVSPPRSG